MVQPVTFVAADRAGGLEPMHTCFNAQASIHGRCRRSSWESPVGCKLGFGDNSQGRQKLMHCAPHKAMYYVLVIMPEMLPEPDTLRQGNVGMARFHFGGQTARSFRDDLEGNA